MIADDIRRVTTIYAGLSEGNEFLEALADPKHEEHESYLDWVGAEFDPEAFDLEDVNKVLKKYRMLDARG